MEKSGVAIFSFALILLILLFGCLASTNPNPGASGNASGGNSSLQNIETKEFTYPSGANKIGAILCQPKGASSSTPAIVLTGGDGVTAKTLLPVCEAFAEGGMAALAHDNSNGSAGESINAAIDAFDYLQAQNPRRSVSFWGHSAGTVFSAFAAFMRPNATAFIETSGHMQIPICMRANILMKKDGCLAYWNDLGPRLLIVHGENDDVVNISYARAFSSSLDSVNKPHTTLYVSGAGHEFMHNYSGVIDAEIKFIRNQAQGLQG